MQFSLLCRDSLSFMQCVEGLLETLKIDYWYSVVIKRSITSIIEDSRYVDVKNVNKGIRYSDLIIYSLLLLINR